MKKKTAIKKYFSLLFCISTTLFFCNKSTKALTTKLFTIDSSQNALVLLKKIESTSEEALRHLLLSLLGYQKILQAQNDVWQGVENLLQTIPVEIAQLQEKIETLAKDNNDYTELVNQLFSLLNQMTTQVQTYSDYLKTVDGGLLTIIQQQQNAQALIDDLATLCE